MKSVSFRSALHLTHDTLRFVMSHLPPLERGRMCSSVAVIMVRGVRQKQQGAVSRWLNIRRLSALLTVELLLL